MKRKARPILTSEERAAKRAATESRRTLALEAMTEEAGWQAFIAARLRFGHYSWRNCALIAHEAPECSQLGTFNQWRGWGFQVRQGEHARVSIVGPPPFRGVPLFEARQTDMPWDHESQEPDPPEFVAAVEELSAAVHRPLDARAVPEAVEALDRAIAAQEAR